jgi:hypothetical protein
LSALCTGCLYPTENIPGTHFFCRLGQHQGHSAAERVMSMKNLNTPPGIEPVIFQLVEECQNQLCHHAPAQNAKIFLLFRIRNYLSYISLTLLLWTGYKIYQGVQFS